MLLRPLPFVTRLGGACKPSPHRPTQLPLPLSPSLSPLLSTSNSSQHTPKGTSSIRGGGRRQGTPLPLQAFSAEALLPSTAPPTAPLPLSFTYRDQLHDPQGRLLLRNLSFRELVEWCTAVGEGAPTKRAKQLYYWLYEGRNHNWLRSLDEVDGDVYSFSANFKSKVEQHASLASGLALQSVHTAKDGTHKLVFALLPSEVQGGVSGSVETVLIPMYKNGVPHRYTACVSSQVGCGMNCQFCYTGRMGLMGNLNTAQIVEQVVEARRFLSQLDKSLPIGNIVFMGMGEPLANYDAVLGAIEIMSVGLGLSRKKIIVSTVGLADKMRDFLDADKERAKLALSLHATTDEVRNWIVPSNRRFPLSELVSILERHFPLATSKGDDFVLLEYVLLKGVNDSLEDAHRLLQLMTNVYCMINLIVFNPHDGTKFERSDEVVARAFKKVLTDAGRVCTLRLSKGDDEMAACGQLGDVSAATKPAPLLKPPPSLAASFSK